MLQAIVFVARRIGDVTVFGKSHDKLLLVQPDEAHFYVRFCDGTTVF